MKLEYRPYICNVCGLKEDIQTINEGSVLHYCKNCSWKPSFGKGHKIPALGSHTYREFRFDALNESKKTMPNLKKIKNLKGKMSEEQKKRLLVGLRKLKETTGNVGGETDIAYADNLDVNENEYTSGNTREEPKVVSKTFDTKADFESYVNQRRGIEITPKEQQATISEQTQMPRPQAQSNPPEEKEMTVDDNIRISKTITFSNDTEGADILADFLEELELHNQRPMESDRFHMKYELTDPFGINSTIVIKKLKEGNQFCWTAFAKYEHAEDEGKPKPSDDSSNNDSEKDSGGLDDLGSSDMGPEGEK